MKVFDYTAVVWRETEGYVSKCPELGVASCGDSFEEAVSNLREAVELYLQNAMELDLLDEITESLTAKNSQPISKRRFHDKTACHFFKGGHQSAPLCRFRGCS
jgi:predicted RNase H-like HicB family nuclease